MKESKKDKPDQVVDNPGIMPYTTNVGAPAIQHEDVEIWKKRGAIKVNHHLETRFEEIKKQYQDLIEDFENNNLVYSAKCSFEPAIGDTYYLYESKDGGTFLSLISPEEWKQKFLGAFQIDSQFKWNKL